MHPLAQILGNPDNFLDDLFTQITGKAIGVEKLYMDHICYRVKSIDNYNIFKGQLLKHGELLSDKIIGGRPISVIELTESYHYHETTFF